MIGEKQQFLISHTNRHNMTIPQNVPSTQHYDYSPKSSNENLLGNKKIKLRRFEHSLYNTVEPFYNGNCVELTTV